jgi:glycosyltransferase involved in cell wall biosynthesis
VNFTGFISEFNYKLLLKESDVVVVLTTKDLILNCGAYEAISAIKPLVLSDTRTLRSYFEPGPVFVNIDPQSIADGIQLAWDERGLAKAQLTKLSGRLTESWKQQFEEVVKHIDLN